MTTTVTHNNKQYTVTKLANGHSWQLAEVENPRNKLVLNRDQMIIAGFAHVVNGMPSFNQFQLKAAQNKALIARTIGDGAMWVSAYNDMKKAIGYPWHRRSV
ncbi:hypothetical protein [Lelliottia amnigena]|uniref:host cell division inhibitory peptide Kil n=1 Tax=Lelliottia amnigena TaxID=61646 RepID=UPI003EB95EB2